MSSIFGSSGVCGLATELLTASAIAGSQRNCEVMDGSVSADFVTAAEPFVFAKSVWIGELVNHSRNFLAPWGFGAPDAMPQMKVPIAGALFSWLGVAAMLILPWTFDALGSSTWWLRPVYSVRAMQLPWSSTCTSWSVSNSATPVGMYGMKLKSLSRAPTPSAPAKPGDQSSFTKLPPYEFRSGRYVCTIGLPLTPRADHP